jgi:glutamate/tyrosine decarboxylase-like PLP-dependent enzyme
MGLKFFGIRRHAASIERDLHLADRLAERIRQSRDLKLVIEPGLSIVCFRYAPAHLTAGADALNHMNQRLLTAVQLNGTAFLSSTSVNGVFCLRACVINHRTTEDDIDVLVDHIEQTASELVPQ